MPSSSSARASKRLKGASAQVVNHGTRPELDKEDQENEEPTCTPADGLTEYERLRLRQMQEWVFGCRCRCIGHSARAGR